MKKLLALILAGTLLISMSAYVLAEETGDSDGYTPPATCPCRDPNNCSSAEILGSCGCGAPDCKCTAGGGSSNDSNSYWAGLTPEEIAIAQGSEAAALAQEATGIPWPTAIAASEENKSVGEYMNNAVTSTHGLSQTTPVAQGGNVIINGQPSNQTFSVKKTLPAHVDAAKAQASALGGTVLNCVDIDGSVFFDTATVNFYMPGVVGGQNIQVYHFANGTWSPVNVAEIREDHVVVDMTAYGILTFIEVPAAPAEASAE
ncbi:MAG: hypothetical protein HFI48_00595 [Lachnospiraceae bacterium]|nr:hypothetical protein [Lachnospiraceae bacterium]